MSKVLKINLANFVEEKNLQIKEIENKINDSNNVDEKYFEELKNKVSKLESRCSETMDKLSIVTIEYNSLSNKIDTYLKFTEEKSKLENLLLDFDNA